MVNPPCKDCLKLPICINKPLKILTQECNEAHMYLVKDIYYQIIHSDSSKGYISTRHKETIKYHRNRLKNLQRYFHSFNPT